MAGAAELLAWITRTGLANIVWPTDLDKTLIDAAANPNDTKAETGLEDSCRLLDQKTAGFFIITGRDIAWVDKVFAGGRFRISAEYHCVFRLNPDEEAQELSPVPHWDLIDEELRALVARYPGALLREKKFMRSLHLTHLQAPDKDAARKELHAGLAELLARHDRITGQKLVNTDGGSIFDMRPDTGDKGDAMRAIFEHAQARHKNRLVPVYFGDSPGDIPAALAAKELGGIFVAVGADESVRAVADFCLPDTAAARALFRDASLLDETPAPATVPAPAP